MDDAPLSSPPPDDAPEPGREHAEAPVDAEAVPAHPYEPPHAGPEPPQPPAPAPATGKVRLPLPNLPLAFLLTWLPLFVQIVASIVAAIGVAMYLISMGGRPDQFAEWFGANQTWQLPFGTGITTIVAILVALVFFQWSTPRLLALRGLDVTQLLATVLVTIPLAVLASEFANLVSEFVPLIEPDFLEMMRETSVELFTQVSEQSWWFIFVSGCLLPGIGEEIFCRGVIGRGLVARWGVIGGVFWTSLLFGMMHVDPIQGSGAFVLGLAFHLVFLTTRSLFAPILLHALNNTLAFASLKYRDVYPIPGLVPTPEGETEHVPLFLIAAAVLSAICWSAYLIQSRTQWVTPENEVWSPGYVTAETPPAWLGCRPQRRSAHGVLLLLGLVSTVLLVLAIIAAHEWYA